ncbi:SDR family NAD(P)-dependent oxidoreductase [Actinoallomurus oryzae]|uniref:SDR family NAD(P)-dependent oxidoreductase n=1 Tax=Actinoallomurus oryzae TaxID=502180 RepID=A0ABP8PVX9_9ACTN
MTRWTAADIADLYGRIAVVTGANTGTGFETARLLAEHGATVVLACRDLEKAATAAARIGRGAQILHLDLASLASVRQAAADLHRDYPKLDLLINNAGIMRTPYGRTEDGFEMQFGTNHLGHFAFTGLVLDLLHDVDGARVVTVTSPAHRQTRGGIDFTDLQSERKYRAGSAYSRSKLANLLFAYELQRRLEASGARTVSLAAHPGGARTELNRNMPVYTLARGASWGIWRPITHPAEIGALSLVRAAVDPAARGGEYYCPDGRMEFKGHPVRRESSAESHDADLQRRLWLRSAQLTGVRYDLVEHS